jgi:dynein heavy chain 1
MEDSSKLAIASPNEFIDYLFSLAKVLQGARGEDVIYFNITEVKEVVLEFSITPLPSPLFVSHLSQGGWCISTSLEDIPSETLSTLVVIKQKGPLVAGTVLEQQLQVVNLPQGGSSFDTLRSLISVGIGSFFSEITAHNDTEIVTSTKKKINELALSLQHLNQMIHVPDLSLSLHPIIKDAVSRGANLNNYTELFPEDTLMDSSFLNSVQAIVNDWVKSIQAVTRVDRKVSEGSALDEANFWISMEASLSAIQNQVDSDGVQIALEVLKYAKRYHATVGFLSDIGIKDAVALTADYNKLMKDIPLQELVSAESFVKIQESIILIFNHLKKLRVTSYPISRALSFVEAISSDLEKKLTPMLLNIMSLNFGEFMEQTEQLYAVLETWDRQVKEFINLARELLRKRDEKFLFVKINSKTTLIKERLDDSVEFRNAHREFADALKNLDALQKDLDYAYDAVKDVDILDSEKTWSSAKRSYDKRIQQIEDTVVDELRVRLESQRNSNEMFQVFETYRALLERPRIRAAVQEYQSQLLSTVKSEITHLQTNFSLKSDLDHVAHIKDYPNIAYTLQWANQTRAKLSFLLEKIEVVLGKDWSSYAEGQKIYAETMVFQNRLKLENLYDEWLQLAPEKEVKGCVIVVTKDSDVGIHVNFDDDLLSFYKEVRALSYQAFQIPHSVMLSARQVRKVYPHAVVMRESFDMLFSIFEDLASLNDFEILIEDEKQDLFRLIIACLEVDWESLSKAQDLHELNVTLSDSDSLFVILRLEAYIFDLYIKSEKLQSYYQSISRIFKALETCEYSDSVFSGHISSAQDLIDSISNDGFSNLDSLAQLLNEKIVKILAGRFIDSSLSNVHEEHVLFIANSVDIEPPLEDTKLKLYSAAQKCVHVILGQRPITIKTLEGQWKQAGLDFISEMAAINHHMDNLLYTIETDLYATKEFVNTWYQFQTLWDVNIDGILSGLSLDEWFELFDDIKKSKVLFDSADAVKLFGSFAVNFEDARTQIASKFSLWHREVLDRFNRFLHELSKETHGQLLMSRKVLEANTLNISSVQDMVSTITAVQQQKVLSNSIGQLAGKIRAAERLLVKSRFKFPDDYIYTDQLENDLDVVVHLIANLSKSIDENLDIIHKTVEAECLRVQTSILEAREDWKSSKPPDDTSPPEAIEILSAIENSLVALSSRRVALIEAVSLLELPVTIPGDVSDAVDEVKDLKSVWSSLQSLWALLEDLKNLSWYSLKPRGLRKHLEELLAATRSMPVRVRQHQPFQEFLKTITDLSNCQKILMSLKEEFIRDRHLKSLFKSLGRTIPPKLTLGEVWSLNLMLNESIVNSIIDQANSERAIEDSIQEITEIWDDKEFEFFDLKGHSIIKNFPFILQLTSDHLASLGSMRNSPAFKVFDKEVTHWEATLNEIYQIVDLWIVVQRQWIDLEGVFDDGSGIRKLLTTEYSRFHGVSSEYQGILRKVFNSPVVAEIRNIQDLFQTIERLSDSLSRISKALSEFLEKQRELCARLYFVGNDDLIDMIANKDNVGKHMKKMFPGIYCIQYSDDRTLITSVVASNGETVVLNNAVSLVQYPRLDEWMNQLEYEIKVTLSDLVLKTLHSSETLNSRLWYLSNPLQVVLLTLQITWTRNVESAILDGSLGSLLDVADASFSFLISDCRDQKVKEALLIEIVHQRAVIRSLIESCTKTLTDFSWLQQQRFYLHEDVDVLERVEVRQSSKSFIYGFEYLGHMDRLVYTPLLNNCFISMTGALEQGLGGSPFGPAGTGKTETIKALGQNLGKLVLVFNCDESFDFQAISRLLLGICQIGGWCCFDEFNRLEENILSAVSSQLELIELGLKSNKNSIKLLSKHTPLSNGTGLFVTMNPEYSGRSTLPENLKKLFRSFSMQRPDSSIIAQILLRARGFSEADILCNQIVRFFELLEEKTSSQKHYDFGLRALKSTLEHSERIKLISPAAQEGSIVVKSLNEMVLPRLVSSDVNVYHQIRHNVFGEPEVLDHDIHMRESLCSVAKKEGYVSSSVWLEKAIQLFKILETQQGVMLVGRSGSGKSSLWKSLSEALTGQFEITTYVIDPKVMSKSELFGFLDPITREWVDGLLTSIIRRVIEDLRGEASHPTWIIFDGDVDPVWVESLNSVLDDNKALTLPNGERLKIPSSVRFLFEVDNLEHATPATVSRCGMIWVEDTMLSPLDIFNYEMQCFRSKVIENSTMDSNNLKFQNIYADTLSEVVGESLLNELITFSENELHPVMEMSSLEKIRTTFLFIRSFLCRSLPFFSVEFSLTRDFVLKSLLLSLTWAFAGSCILTDRLKFAKQIVSMSAFQLILPSKDDFNILDYDIDHEGSWNSFLSQLKPVSLESHAIADPNTVIGTVDTLRHQNIVSSVLQQKKSLILCGPPGSGKTMTLYAALQQSPEIEVLNLNFSKDTDPSSVMKALEQICEYKRTGEGFSLRPRAAGKRVVVFADEINLPRKDEYGTQKVINFMRQLIEQGGFWRVKDMQWIEIFNIQFVGACNPPTDSGRISLSPRFLSHVPVIMVDYPGDASLAQIYTAFNTSVLKIVPQLSGHGHEVTNAMIEVYMKTKEHFTTVQKAHYVYSPRELTRWVRGLYAALRPLDTMDLPGLVRLWAHEALRLFSDRLSESDDKIWMWSLICSVAGKNFPIGDMDEVLRQPILYSDWLSLNYEPVSQSDISSFIKERLRVFSDEVLDINLTLYPEAVDHILRIDRVLKQPQGHMILVGPSSSGKTTLTKFVAWANGLSVHQLNVRRRYTLSEFDHTLKDLLTRTGLQGEKICFIVDESTILDGAFLERMNSLLANSQIQEIFDQEEYSILLSGCRDQINARGLLLDTAEEIYNWFIQQVAANLHVVFTISDPDNANAPQIIASPALFNRCVLNWMGYWSNDSLIHVTQDMLRSLPIDKSSYSKPTGFEAQKLRNVESYRDAVIECFLLVHDSSPQKVSPGKLIEMINTFIKIYDIKAIELGEQQTHINTGLIKLKETMIKVKALKDDLSIKEKALIQKEIEAKKTLNKILVEQNEAERKQEASIEIQAVLERQEMYIEDRRKLVMEDLALAEPAVLEARRGVQNIKKQHLTELRSMSTPPAMVQLVLESVCVLLGYQVQTWRDVQSVIRKDDFIASIVTFDCESQVTSDVREFMTQKYLSRTDYSFPSAERASKACGPLLQWVEAQIKYAIVLDKIGPLRAEVQALEADSNKTQARLMAADDMIRELQDRIEHYKDEYSLLIRETENIKSEMMSVEAKVRRSSKLVESLSSERTRWAESIKDFDLRHLDLCGSALIAAALVTHAGALDFSDRSKFLTECCSFLDLAGVSFEKNFRLSSFLNSPSNLLVWESCGLPNDNQFFENITILEHSLKTSLIIDPYGNILDAISSKALPKKMSLTSFLDDGFVRTLENSLRFGGYLVIQDAEYFDPIISPLLNGEVQRIGGRSLVKIGGRDIDCAKTFELILHTRDTSLDLSSFVSTRTSVIDFTITDNSLETQGLNMTLAKEAPKVENQRMELIKLGGEYKVRLRDLEDSLLSTLSESKRDLLENSDLLEALEKLKKESIEVQQKMSETADVMRKIEEVTAQYDSFIRSIVLVHGVVTRLSALSEFYQFSLSSYTDSLSKVLETDSNHGITRTARVSELTDELYKEVFAKVSVSLTNKHKMVFGLALSLVHLSERNSPLFSKFVLLILRNSSHINSELIIDAFRVLSINLHSTTVSKLSEGMDISDVDDNLSDLQPLLSSLFGQECSFVDLVSGQCEPLRTGPVPFSSKYSLGDVISSNKGAPIILGSASGFDASSIVRVMADACQKSLCVIAMGSQESIEIASRELSVCAKSGSWLLIQNIQTAEIWLEYLEKKLQNMVMNPTFKLFLTCDAQSHIPRTLLRNSDLVMFENPPGVKTLLTGYMKVIDSKKTSSQPVEKLHVFFLVAWYHAILQELSRFVPLSLSKNYDFNDADFEAALFLIDRWFATVKPGRNNVAPESIDWKAIQFLVLEVVYGGKVTNRSDAQPLKNLANSLFRLDAFENSFNLIENQITARNDETLSPPEGKTIADYRAWIDRLPDLQPASWLGLEKEVESQVKKKEQLEILDNAELLFEKVLN